MSRENIKQSIQRNKPMTVMNNNMINAAIITVPEIKIDEYKAWVTNLYDISGIKQEDIHKLWEQFSYKGFNRDDVLKQLSVFIKDKRIVIELIIAGAISGPQRGANIKLSNGKSSIEMGIPASGRQGNKTLTLNKIVASTADLAAWFLKQMDNPKRINSELPGWLQFPSAGSIDMPEYYRKLHKDFSERFSTLIGGEFNEQIYNQMVSSAYINPKLNLFQ